MAIFRRIKLFRNPEHKRAFIGGILLLCIIAYLVINTYRQGQINDELNEIKRILRGG